MDFHRKVTDFFKLRNGLIFIHFFIVLVLLRVFYSLLVSERVATFDSPKQSGVRGTGISGFWH